LLLWAHYADSFKGYCLEFKTDIYPFSKLRKVTYSNCIPSFDLVSFVSDYNEDQFVDSLFLKSQDWHYENEYRLLHDKVNINYIYPPDSLKAIYFGPRMKLENKEILCLILKGQNPTVELWDSKLSDQCFAINFNKIEYKTYLESKNTANTK